MQSIHNPHWRYIGRSLALMVILAATWGTFRDASGEDGSPADSAQMEEAPVPADLGRGEKVYQDYCIGCHGAAGDGQGEAAALLYPKPRDFVTAEYKFSSRPTPDLPTDEDLLHVLRTGLRGTSMSSFEFLSQADLEAVIGYIKSFSDRWEEDFRDALPTTPDPWRDDPTAAAATGDAIYHVEAMCITCHPSYHNSVEIEAMCEEAGYAPIVLRADYPFPVPRETADGSLLMPPDFKRDRIKSGDRLENLHRVISSGITTTAMPTWTGVLDERSIWALAHYIHSLSERREVRLDPGRYLLRPALDLELDEEAEQYVGEDFE